MRFTPLFQHSSLSLLLLALTHHQHLATALPAKDLSFPSDARQLATHYARLGNDAAGPTLSPHIPAPQCAGPIKVYRLWSSPQIGCLDSTAQWVADPRQCAYFEMGYIDGSKKDPDPPPPGAKLTIVCVSVELAIITRDLEDPLGKALQTCYWTPLGSLTCLKGAGIIDSLLELVLIQPSSSSMYSTPGARVEEQALDGQALFGLWTGRTGNREAFAVGMPEDKSPSRRAIEGERGAAYHTLVCGGATEMDRRGGAKQWWRLVRTPRAEEARSIGF
ncbi:MAG: hypothetical protein M1829_003620 [Trizodia sp. TS-e1964]|nr:MAG: hypothetical protein M1829_003620 [Trizodia sp. TS-e1964]